MVRIRWTDLVPDDPSSPAAWRYAALIIATIFLNFPFFELASESAPQGSLWFDAAVSAAAVAVFAVLFFFGPARAARLAGGLFVTLEQSLGTIPSAAIRVCCVGYAGLWTAFGVATLVNCPFLQIDRDVDPGGSVELTVVLLIFLIGTSLTGNRNQSGLAAFSSGAGIAILAAACIRTHAGWSDGLTGAAYRSSFGGGGLGVLWLWSAPLLLLGSDLVRAFPSTREVVKATVAGIAAPAFVALTVVAFTVASVWHSGLYRPSLQPTFTMALFAEIAPHGVAPRAALAMIPASGGLRFAFSAIKSALPLPSRYESFRPLVFLCVSAVVAWIAIHAGYPLANGVGALALPAIAIGLVAAVLTADSLLVPRPTVTRRVDWPAVCAIAAGGLAMWLSLTFEAGADSWFPWTLFAYAATFVSMMAGRFVTRLKH